MTGPAVQSADRSIGAGRNDLRAVTRIGEILDVAQNPFQVERRELAAGLNVENSDGTDIRFSGSGSGGEV